MLEQLNPQHLFEFSFSIIVFSGIFPPQNMIFRVCYFFPVFFSLSHFNHSNKHDLCICRKILTTVGKLFLSPCCRQRFIAVRNVCIHVFSSNFVSHSHFTEDHCFCIYILWFLIFLYFHQYLHMHDFQLAGR